MTRKINVHADDFGISQEITDNILDSINNGAVNSTSVVCNTDYFDTAMQKYNQISKKIRLCLHLNLVEGKPVSPQKKSSIITNEQGEFKHSFLSLWVNYLIANKKKQKLYKEKIKTEIEFQILRYKKVLGNDEPLFVDSHMHFHMIPFVFDCIIELAKKYKIDFIRNPYELRYTYALTNVKNHLSLNLVKNVLLNNLSKRNMKLAKEMNIDVNDYFVGVLSTGRMTEKDTQHALGEVEKKSNSPSVDVLFHPGGIANKDSIYWTEKEAFKTYYTSKERLMEAKVLRTTAFKQIIQRYETVFSN